jgi:hypothetical protein
LIWRPVHLPSGSHAWRSTVAAAGDSATRVFSSSVAETRPDTYVSPVAIVDGTR